MTLCINNYFPKLDFPAKSSMIPAHLTYKEVQVGSHERALELAHCLQWVLYSPKGFLGGSDSKESTYNARDMDWIAGSERSLGEGNGNPLQFFGHGKFHGQRSLVGYSTWAPKKFDIT